MWIKKITTSLYVSFFVKTVVCALISVLLFVLLVTLSRTYIDLKNTQIQDELRIESDAIARDIIEQITTNKMTFKQAEEMDFDGLPIYQVMLINEVNLSQSVIEGLSHESVFGYDVEFADSFGQMYINVYGLEVQGDIFYILSAVISVVLFLILVINSIAKEISYVKEIESGIKLIATDDILYKIPIKGKNELANLAFNINSMGDSIHASRQKERQDEINQRLLITNMSHDLKTPLTSMTGYIDVIKSKLSEDDELYQYANIAKENGNRLEQLISDLFLYSKLISGDVPINLQKVDIAMVMRQILEIRSENVDLNLSNDVQGDLLARIDAEKFHRVMDNLLSNAKKYGVENSKIRIIIDKIEDGITISVQNETDDDLEGRMDKLTNRLYTAREDRANGSSGLGLSIATELVLMMEGELSFQFNNRIFTATIKLPVG